MRSSLMLLQNGSVRLKAVVTQFIARIFRHCRASGVTSRFWLQLVVLLLLASAASGQDTSITDGKTPTGLTPGAPAGSYSLSGFENVNLFNGNLSFKLPLMSIGGRGSAGYTMMLPIEQKWIVKKGQTGNEITPMTPSPNWWQGIKPGYGAGVMHGRRTGYGEYPANTTLCGLTPNASEQTLTRLTFTGSDGTEYELRDQLTNVAPAHVSEAHCQHGGASRGKVFVTADGSSATFISSEIIYDRKELILGHEHRLFYPTGDLILKDGTRYHIVDGVVRLIRDRNGNQVTFNGNTITDSLNRTVTIGHDAGCDEIVYSGFGGVERKIRVCYDSLFSRLLRRDYEDTRTYHQLFALNSADPVSKYNPQRVSEVELPDHRRYKFYYNPWGELARVVLPTGGAYEYDWEGFAEPTDGIIFRYVTKRRVYLAGSTAEQTTEYIRNEVPGRVDVKTFNAANTLMEYSRHYFYGDAYDSMREYEERPSAISSSPWKEGREYKTESFEIVNGDPATLPTQTVQHTWQQPAAGTTWPLTDAETSADVKANDPQITETLTTLADTNLVTKQAFSYDRYSNRTDVYEYDYGSGTAGPLVRRTHTSYLTTHPATGHDYACNPATTCGNDPIIGNIIHLRSLPTEVSVYDELNTLKAQTVFEYDNYTTADVFHAALVTYPRPAHSELPISGLDAGFNSTTNKDRGNVTKTTRNLLNTSGALTSSINSYAQYDVVGNVVKVIDPRSTVSNIIATSLDYRDRFGGPNGEARANLGSLNLNNAGKNSYAFPTMITNALGHTSYTQFDYHLGQPVDGEDANGIFSSAYSENDDLDRPTRIVRAVNTPAQNQTVFVYDDDGRTITTSSDLNTNADGALVSKVFYDGLGRTVETRQYEGGTNYIATQQEYDALGRAFKTSNPFRPWQMESPVWTTTSFDALGRLRTVTTPDGASVTTDYHGNQVLVTDQSGKKRISETNALGHLKHVWEITPNDPTSYPGIEPVSFKGQSLYGYHTSYSYDTLDDLTNVSQESQGSQGSQPPRQFVYDSLKRLISAVNPESGTIGYQYDPNGNLTQKTDARGIVSTYIYDALNRNLSITYTNDPAGTPAVHRYFDGFRDGVNHQIPNSKGRLWQTETSGPAGSRTTVNSFDPLGRPENQSQQFHAGSEWKSFVLSATYNKAGNVLTQTYPSFNTVTYAYDAAGRTSSFSGNLGDGGLTRTYASDFQYTDSGAVQQEKFGTDTPLYHKQRFTERGQLWDMRLSTVPFATDPANGDRGSLVNYYSNNFVPGGTGADNNGNLLRQTMHIPGNGFFQQNFSYDSLNRLKSVAEKLNGTGADTFKQSYLYDRWGNRTINTNASETLGGVNNLSFDVQSATNRLYAPGDLSLPEASRQLQYDQAGNLKKDQYTGAGDRVYDAENRMVSAATAGVSPAAYSYNGDGQRVRRKVDDVETWQVYGFDGELLAEYPADGNAANPEKEYGYRNGQLLITAEPSSSTSSPAYSGWGADIPGTIQMENFDSGAEGSAYHDTTSGSHGQDYDQPGNPTPSFRQPTDVDIYKWSGYSNGYLVLGHAGEWLNYTVSVATTGAYNMQAQVAWGGAAGSLGTFHVEVDGVDKTGPIQIPDTNWTFATVNKSGIQLTAGQHVLRVVWDTNAGNGYVGDIDYLSFQAASGQSPYTGTPLPIPGTVETEYFDNGGEGVAYHDTTAGTHGQDYNQAAPFTPPNFRTTSDVDIYAHSGYSNGYLIVMQSSDWMKYAVNVAQSGNYTIHARVVWGGNAGGTFHVEVDGVDKTGPLQIPNTNWNFQTLTKAGVHLTAGVHMLRIVADSSDANGFTGDVDNLVFTLESASAQPSNIHWLVADHLGTPRMVIDKTGSLAGIKRHDYLPFGEELAATQGSRTPAMGYGADDTQQKFTGKERDIETGLDYFGARYYSSVLGRFAGPDSGPFTPADPQSWNRYPYVQNSPLKFIDPSGRKLELTGEAAIDYLDFLRKNSGLSLSLDSKTRKVTIDKGSKRNEEGTSKELARQLKKVIGADETVSINVTENKPQDNFVDDYTVRTVDFADVKAIDSQESRLAVALSGHVLSEYLDLAKGMSYDDVTYTYKKGKDKGAHSRALEVESRIMSEYTGVKEKTRETVDNNPTFSFVYSSVQYDVSVKTSPKGTTDIDKVTKKKLP